MKTNSTTIPNSPTPTTDDQSTSNSFSDTGTSIVTATTVAEVPSADTATSVYYARPAESFVTDLIKQVAGGTLRMPDARKELNNWWQRFTPETRRDIVAETTKKISTIAGVAAALDQEFVATGLSDRP